jgi:EpsI family protein
MADLRLVAGYAVCTASNFALTQTAKFQSRPCGDSVLKLRARLAITVTLLAATGLLLQARGRNEVFPHREPLNAFPLQLGEWSGTDVTIPQDVLDILGPGYFLLRIYHNTASPNVPHSLVGNKASAEKATTQDPNVDLFVAYFPSQRAGDTIHSPKNCLPGAGWSPVESRRVQIALPGHAPFVVNRYIIAKGENRQLVLYWYWAHDRAVASEYWAKVYLVTDSMRLNRSDGSLVRVTTPLRPNESADSAQQRLLTLAGYVVPILNQYVPK